MDVQSLMTRFTPEFFPRFRFDPRSLQSVKTDLDKTKVKPPRFPEQPLRYQVLDEDRGIIRVPSIYLPNGREFVPPLRKLESLLGRSLPETLSCQTAINGTRNFDPLSVAQWFHGLRMVWGDAVKVNAEPQEETSFVDYEACSSWGEVAVKILVRGRWERHRGLSWPDSSYRSGRVSFSLERAEDQDTPQGHEVLERGMLHFLEPLTRAGEVVIIGIRASEARARKGGLNFSVPPQVQPPDDLLARLGLRRVELLTRVSLQPDGQLKSSL